MHGRETSDALLSCSNCDHHHQAVPSLTMPDLLLLEAPSMGHPTADQSRTLVNNLLSQLLFRPVAANACEMMFTPAAGPTK